jgi:DNA-binding response OmpR family regulator
VDCYYDLAQTAAVRAPRRRTSVLVVEDDRMLGYSLQMLLEEDGFDAATAQSCAAALALVSGGLRPDVIISDYRLPEQNGLEGIRRLRGALGADIPAILVTGETALSVPVQDMPANCTVAVKPLPAEALGDMVRDALRRNSG